MTRGQCCMAQRTDKSVSVSEQSCWVCVKRACSSVLAPQRALKVITKFKVVIENMLSLALSARLTKEGNLQSTCIFQWIQTRSIVG